jgi:nicotinamide-nucleotide amidase
MQNISAEIVAIGTELLLGEITDTNSVWLAQQLRDLGINLFFMTTVGDNEGRIRDAIRLAMGRADIVLTCGGLGPTVDDMTRQAVASATERELVFHPALLEHIAERFASFRMAMPDNNRNQAYVPAEAHIIDNAVGTAPGFMVEHQERVVISLPGVPREMKYLFTEHVVPYLRTRYALGQQVIKARVLRTAGIGESLLDEQIGQDLLRAENPTVGLAAHSGQVDIRITAKADTLAEAERMIGGVETMVRSRVGRYIFGTDQYTLDQAVADALQATPMRVVVIEAGVPALISQRLTAAMVARNEMLEVIRFEDTTALAETCDLHEAASSARTLAKRAAYILHAAQQGHAVVVVVLSRAASADTPDRADRDDWSALAIYDGANLRVRSYGFSGSDQIAEQFMSTWGLAMLWLLVSEHSHA